MKKRWIVRPPDIERQELLGRELRVSPLTAQLLINRGLVDIDKAFSFLSPSLKDLHNPFAMKDMDKAAERIIEAVRKGEGITVYGDYDVDGTTGTALLYLFFKDTGIDVKYYIPERLKEGYGLNRQALKHLADSGTKLVITTDLGIANYDEVIFANSIGLDIIITDHHEPPEKLPPAYAVLNPKQPGCSFPFKELAGVGVAFNLIIALRARLKDCGYFANGNIPNLKGYTDIVALGTIADMVPLIDENRILVKYGLEELTAGRRPGVRALKEVSGLNNIVKAGSVGFQLAPRINAAGRLDNARTGVRLLIADDAREASDIARELNRENIERQRLESDMLSEALAVIQGPGFNIQDKKAVVLAKDGWHPGIIGIVASRIVGRYHRPTIIISLKDGIGKGSARGIKGIDMLGNLKECSGFLDKYGGHKMAAGFSIREENVKLFESAFYTLADGKLSFEDLIPDISLDSYIKLDEINEKIITEIEGLAPFGLANPEPLLAIRDVNIVQSKVVGKNHLSLQIKAMDLISPAREMWSGIAYRMGNIHPLSGNGFDIACVPYIDEWNGNKTLKLRVKEIRHSAEV